MIDSFLGARLKVNRAEKHITDIRKSICLLQQSYVPVVDIDVTSGGQVLKYRSEKVTRLLEEMALILGDAIHNLRSSLDHAWLVVAERVVPGIVGKHTRFPFDESGLEQLEARLKGINIHLYSPALFAAVLETKPYCGGNNALWALHDLDVRDKHRLLIPVITYGGVDKGIMQDQAGRSYNITSFGTYGDDSFYYEVPDGFNIQDNGEFTVNVLFSEGTFESVEVSSALDLLLACVNDTLERLVSFVR